MKALLLAGLATLAVQAQPRVQTFVLPNGLRVFHLEDHEHPLVRATLRVNLEPTDTPPGLNGLALLSLRMLEHSDAGGLKAEDFDRILDASSIQLTRTSTARGLEWHLTARSRDQDRAMGLLADRLLRTVLDPSVLETQRLAGWLDVDNLEASPRTRLRRALAWEPGTQPTRPGLEAITFDDLLGFKARVLRPDRAILVLHGDLGFEQAKRLVLLNLGSWATSKAPPARLPAPRQVPPEPLLRIPARGEGLRIQAVAAPPGELSPEATLLLGLLIPGDPSLPPVQCEALEIGLVATLDAEATTTATGAWNLLHARLEGLRQRGFTQRDLERARQALLARRSLDSLHPEALLAATLADALGDGVDPQRMQALSLETLNADLRRWLEPARIHTGATGDPEMLKQLP